jgi:hypothetical protein
LCAEPVCCPPEGRLLSTDDPAAVVMAESGLTAVASRDDLAATIAAVTGAEAKAMQKAMRQAARVVGQELDEFGRDAMFDKLRDTVKSAIASYREGGTITDPVELARVCLALRAMEVRDDAWARMRPEHRAAHRQLWIDLTRHAMPGYAAAPASLLAFVAWQDGDGVLASLALERALADDPGYTMAQLIAQALTAALPPSLAVLPVTPEEVAAMYKKPDPGQ